MSGGRPPNPSPSFPPSFLSFSQLSFWVEADFYQSSSVQQAVRKHKHVKHRPRGPVTVQEQDSAACHEFPSPRGSTTRISDQTSASGLCCIKFSQYQKYQYNSRQGAPPGDSGWRHSKRPLKSLSFPNQDKNQSGEWSVFKTLRLQMTQTKVSLSKRKKWNHSQFKV